jgi:hypothetical protein
MGGTAPGNVRVVWPTKGTRRRSRDSHVCPYRDLERFAVEAGALARVAGDLDVGHEIELGRDHTLALTLLAAAALDVEAESARLVARVRASY